MNELSATRLSQRFYRCRPPRARTWLVPSACSSSSGFRLTSVSASSPPAVVTLFYESFLPSLCFFQLLGLKPRPQVSGGISTRGSDESHPQYPASKLDVFSSLRIFWPRQGVLQNSVLDDFFRFFAREIPSTDDWRTFHWADFSPHDCRPPYS